MAQTARFASGKVMTSVAEFMTPKTNAAVAPPRPLTTPPASASSFIPPSETVVPGLTVAALAAMQAELESDRAAAQVQLAAMRAELNAQAASAQQHAAAAQQQNREILELLATMRAAVPAPTAPASAPAVVVPV